jgi:hypothetical protein
LKTGGTSDCVADRDISFSVAYCGVLKHGGMSSGKRSVASEECLSISPADGTSQQAQFQIGNA